MHLTFARRAYELARWYRAQGSIVVLGGLHVLSCPEEALEHADAIAIGDGVQLWPTILADIEHGKLQRRYAADYSRPYRSTPAAAASSRATRSYDDERDRDARVSQSLRLLLPVDGRPAHAIPDARGAAGRR